MTETSPDNNNNAGLFATPGQLLRAQREKQELSLQDIANRIHLDIKIIESIEKDNYEGMPAATYVKGYLRSYAKTVGADADNVVKLYNEDSPQPPPEILPEVKPPTQVSSSDKPVKAFTYLITLGLVLLLLIWYQSHFVVDTSSSNEAVNKNTATSINGVDITYDIVVHPDSWQSPKPFPEEDLEANAATALPANHNDSLELQTDSGDQTIGIISIEGIDDKSSTSPSAQGPDKIDLKLTRDSWIEIVDANNKKLFHDLALGGEQHSITGTAPFKVLLGYSLGISIEFNGKSFDPAPYSTNGVARFTLPAQ